MAAFFPHDVTPLEQGARAPPQLASEALQALCQARRETVRTHVGPRPFLSPRTGPQSARRASVASAPRHVQGRRQAVQARARARPEPLPASKRTALRARLLSPRSAWALPSGAAPAAADKAPSHQQVDFKAIAKAQVNKERTPEEYAKMACSILRTERRRRAARRLVFLRTPHVMPKSERRPDLPRRRWPPAPRRRRRKIAEAGIEYEFPGFESSLPRTAKKTKFAEDDD